MEMASVLMIKILNVAAGKHTGDCKSMDMSRTVTDKSILYFREENRMQHRPMIPLFVALVFILILMMLLK